MPRRFRSTSAGGCVCFRAGAPVVKCGLRAYDFSARKVRSLSNRLRSSTLGFSDYADRDAHAEIAAPHDCRSAASLCRNCGGCRTTLSAQGYCVIEAANAQRALIEAASHKPDVVVLLDLGLPDADRHAVVAGIRQ